ncbi:Gti1/Pac2 family-domain-containing protein [Fomitopsis betulina]|nr:Gti1/Pac2 family-domain-containing protein [Fomitopsis betulina]
MSPSVSSNAAVPSGHATIPALHLRDARDAHLVFEAVRLNILPLITRRLTATEREQLKSGNVFVWEEAEHKQGGLERWTDGRRWSQSRMRGDYLFYEEKIETTPEEKAAKAARRARRTLDPFSFQPVPTRQDRPSKPDGLTKQTYSTHVYTNANEPRKWHIVAYFCGDDYQRLPVVEDYDFLKKIKIPEGVFSSPRGNPAKITRMLTSPDERARNDGNWSKTASWSPQSPSGNGALSPIERPESSSSSSSSSTTLSTSSESTVFHHGDSDGHFLPRLSNIIPIHPLNPPHSHTQSHSSHSPNYAALTNEDRRALSSFRVVL